MEVVDVFRSNGVSLEVRDVRSLMGFIGGLENGVKVDGKDVKIINGYGGETVEGKSLGSFLRLGEGKGFLFLGNEWRRFII